MPTIPGRPTLSSTFKSVSPDAQTSLPPHKNSIEVEMNLCRQRFTYIVNNCRRIICIRKCTHTSSLNIWTHLHCGHVGDETWRWSLARTVLNVRERLLALDAAYRFDTAIKGHQAFRTFRLPLVTSDLSLKRPAAYVSNSNVLFIGLHNTVCVCEMMPIDLMLSSECRSHQLN